MRSQGASSSPESKEALGRPFKQPTGFGHEQARWKRPLLAHGVALAVLLVLWDSAGAAKRRDAGELVAAVPPAALREGRLRLDFAPGEVPRSKPLRIVLRGRTLSFTVLGTYPGGGVASLVVDLGEAAAGKRAAGGARRPGSSAGSPGSAASLLACGPVLSVPAESGLRLSLERRPAAAPEKPAPVALPSIGAWLRHSGGMPSPAPRPAWWRRVEVEFPPEIASDDDAAMLAYAKHAYAERGAAKEAIRLLAAVSRKAERRSPRVALKARYEVAYLYEVFLHDYERALDEYVSLGMVPLPRAEEMRQNVIAADMGVLRCLVGLGDLERVCFLAEQMARTLLLADDSYGKLLLPEVFLILGRANEEQGREEAARASYRASIEEAARIPMAARGSYRAPADTARRRLAILRGHRLRFDELEDGSYLGRAEGFNDVISLWFTVSGGRAVRLKLDHAGDKRPLGSYESIPGRILDSQRLDVDAVTGATVTSDAIVNAVADGILRKARKADDEER